MILVWFERSRGDEFDYGNNFQIEKKFGKKHTSKRSRIDYFPHIMSDGRKYLNRNDVNNR